MSRESQVIASEGIKALAALATASDALVLLEAAGAGLQVQNSKHISP